MARKQSETLSEQMEALRAEIKLITDNEEATEDEVARGDALLEEFKQLDARRQTALKREADVDAVMRAALNPGNREDGAAKRQGPEVIIKRNAFEEDAELVEIARSASRSGSQGGEVVNFEAAPAIERARYAVDQVPRWVNDKSKERLHELLDIEDDVNTPLIARHLLLTGAPEYRDAFKEYVRTGGKYLPEVLRTAMSLASAGAGGVLVPHYLDPTIILTNAGVYAGTIRGLATIKTIGVTKWEGVSSAGVSAQWTGEATATTDDSPSFGTPSITVKKADAWLTGSYEFFEDSGFSNDLARLLADAKARLEENAFATGNTGATQPRGVVAAVRAVTASIVTSGTASTLARADIDSVNNAINPRQEQNMAWLAAKATYSKIRAFDTAGGSAFWANLQVGQPPILMGVPALKSSVMDTALATTSYPLLAGDFSQYYIVDRIGMSVIYDPLVKSTSQAPMGQAGWYAHWRVGADVVNADAFRLLQLNTTAAAVALA